MKRPNAGRAALFLSLAAAVVAATALAAGSAMAKTSASDTFVIDNSFTIKTADPQRAFDPTASLVDRGIYDTLFTYKGGDLAHPVPLLVSSSTATSNAKTFTFKLKKNVHFADGTPLTSADVVFSLRRLVNLKGNPAFLLAGVTVAPAGKNAVVMRSKTPVSPAPGRAREPLDGIVNSALVKQHGGTDAANAAKADKAEQWLNSPDSKGAGSGPYTLSSYSTTSQITLVPNTSYWGARKPAFSSVVVRNMVAPTQLINVGRGSHEAAVDLSADQAQTLKSNGNVNIVLQPSTWVFWLFANNNPKISAVTSNKSFQKAIRYALDYPSIVGVAGPGAIQAPGMIPSMFLGALPQSAKMKQNLAKAKAALAASGDASEEVTLEYPSDLTINGVPFTTLAQKVQANLQAAGFSVKLSGSPTSNWLSALPGRQDGARPLAVGPRLPGSGRLPGLHAGEPGRSAGGLAEGLPPAVEALAAKALVTTAPAARKSIYQRIQRLLNQSGPYFPLIQPTQVFVSTKDLRNAVYNAVYLVDVTQVSPK